MQKRSRCPKVVISRCLALLSICVAAMVLLSPAIHPSKNTNHSPGGLPHKSKLYRRAPPSTVQHSFSSLPWELAPAIDKDRRPGLAIPLFISYQATLGLCNQMFSHINALALGYFMNASLILTDTKARHAFGTKVVEWVSVPPNRTLDLQRMTTYWQQRGLSFSTVRATSRGAAALPNACELQVALCRGQLLAGTLVQASPTALLPLRVWCLMLQTPSAAQQCSLVEHFVDTHSLPKYLTKVEPWVLTLPAAMDVLTALVQSHLDSVQSSGAPAPSCVNIDIGNPIAMLDQEKSAPYLKQAALGLFMAPQVERAAQRLAEAVDDVSPTSFRAVHLRIEEDWHHFQLNVTDMVALYIKAMQKSGFTDKSPVYVASGIFSAWEPHRIAAVEKRFKDSGVMERIIHQHMLLPADFLEPFDLEQQALMDHLLLMRAATFVGDPYSSFTAFLRERRALHDMSKLWFVPIRETEPRKMFFTGHVPELKQ